MISLFLSEQKEVYTHVAWLQALVQDSGCRANSVYMESYAIYVAYKSHSGTNADWDMHALDRLELW